MTSLVYEVIWVRKFGLVFGVTTYAVSGELLYVAIQGFVQTYDLVGNPSDLTGTTLSTIGDQNAAFELGPDANGDEIEDLYVPNKYSSTG